ncbi:MAG TPA: hypothetical protein VFE51_24140, partial [Verrucomicrobiae bacterium]|nr:hypothetical protein [Verrucomicrobiae bacterium]
MPLGKGRRKLLLVLGIILLISVAFWFSFPWWFPRVLGPLARRAGAYFSSYERVGYSRFRIQDLTLTNESLIVRAGRVEAFVPTVWLWKLAVARDSTPSPFVVLNDWTCQLLPSNKPSSSPGSQLQAAAATLRTVQHWLPSAQLLNGSIQSGETKLVLPSAAWHEGALDAKVILPSEATGQTVTVALRPARPFDLDLSCSQLSLNSTLVISTNESGFDLTSTSLWQSNRVEMRARFGSTDTLPQTATLQATNLVISAALARLPHYKTIAGTVAGQWRDGRFEVNVSAAARPVVDETNWPPAELALQVRGNTNSATLQSFVVRTAFLQASLSNPVNLAFSAPFVRSPTALTLAADLNRQRWIDLRGQVTGTVELAQGPGKFPIANLRITGSDVGNASLQAGSVEVSARVDWPLAQLVTADAHFNDGSVARIRGQIDLEEKSITNGTVHFTGPLARRWLPAGCSFGDLALTGTFEGPIDKLSHEGRLQAGQITVPRFYPLNLNLQWSGQNTSLDHFSLQLSNTNASMTLEGGLDLGTNHVQLELRQLQLQTNGVLALQLRQPLTANYFPRGPASSWSLRMTPLHMAGLAGDLNLQTAVQWPTQGAVDFSLERFPASLLEVFNETELPQVDIAQLKASAAWSNGPAQLTLTASAKGTPAAPALLQAQKSSDQAQALPVELLSIPLQLELNLTGDARGLVLSNLLVSSPTSEVVSAHGFLPLTINPAGASNLVEIQVDQPLRLKASIRRQAYFWRAISQLAGVRLEDPTVDLDLSGTWGQPVGTLMAGIRSIQLNETTLTNLALTDLRLALNVDRQAARLTEGQVLVQGQKVSLTAELPLDESSWAKLAHGQPPSLEKASAQLRIDKAKLAAFEPLFPEVIAPQGELDADLSLRPGTDLEGSMILRNARTRPLGNTA